jgi:hypothetical protein
MRLTCFLCAVAVSAAGCGYSVDSSTPFSGAPVVAPVIIDQPVTQSVPMGLAANYSVTAAGTSPQYQWVRNGRAIPGATGSTYVSAPVTFADTGTSFAVVISNSAGTVTSSTVGLTVTARAPAAGELRFQQVDAASTVNGYGGGNVITASLSAFRAETYAASIGTAFWAGAADNCSVASGNTAAECAWGYLAVPLPATPGLAGLVAGFGSDSFANWSFDLVDPNWPNAGNGTSPGESNAVITSLDLEPAGEQFAVSWVQDQSNQQSAFAPAMHTVAVSDLAAAAAAEGANSRVITALSANAGEITYVSYGWSADPATVYETQVNTTPATGAATAAAALAAAGYIITAIGRADDAGDVVLVGTRRQGDTMARPFMTAQNSGESQALRAAGYATVGVIAGAASNTAQTYLGER